jgi:DNA polymerase (family 10)
MTPLTHRLSPRSSLARTSSVRAADDRGLRLGQGRPRRHHTSRSTIYQRSETAPEGGETERRNADHSLGDDPGTHLGAPLGTVAEDDRHLADCAAGAQGAVDRLDLEGVAQRGDALEPDRLQYAPPVALESARRVANAETEHRLRVQTPAPADGAADEPPVAHRATRRVAGAEGDVRLVRRGDQAGNVAGVVREVGVHGQNELGSLGESPTEAGHVGRPQPRLGRPVEDVHMGKLGREPVCDLTRAVRGSVVDHEHARLEPVCDEYVSEGVYEPLQVLALVVRGQADDQVHRRIIAGVPPELPRNADLAERFELLANLLELDGADAFRLAAYRRAAARMRESAVPVAQLALDHKATRLSGIGSTIENKIVELVETGDLAALAKLRERLPAGLVEVMHVPGLGPKTARKLWSELGIQSLEDLRAAAEAQRLRVLPGLGAKTEEKVLKALATPKANVATGRTLLGRVLPAVRQAVEEVDASGLAERVSEAGSVRRRCETVRDLDLIATAVDPAGLTTFFAERPWVAEVVARGSTKATVVSQQGFRFDLRVVPPESFGNLLQHFTGSKAHNVALREDAVRRGLSVSEYGVLDVEHGETFTAVAEEELYERLGYAWIPPELRENRGELEAARDGGLPRLVELADLKGDLHMHTDWSDGRAPLEEMVQAAREVGHRYVAICDHARRLREGRLERQADAIAAMNESLSGIRILSGVEVDIRADGSLDFADEALAERDWVMASIHGGFDSPSDRLTSRLLAAMDNPHVDCIGHPTGRKLNRRAPYEVDWERVLEHAVETGTFLEINAQPDRLDLSDTHARAAAEAGVRIVISTDAHRVHELANLELGVAQARRGWITPDQVVNARSWREVRKLMKRGR